MRPIDGLANDGAGRTRCKGLIDKSMPVTMLALQCQEQIPRTNLTRIKSNAVEGTVTTALALP